jgi:hypothetical protein
MSRNMFTKLEFYDSLIWTENALKLTYVHLHLPKFSGAYTSDPLLQRRGRVRVGEWRVEEGREGNVLREGEGRGMEGWRG